MATARNRQLVLRGIMGLLVLVAAFKLWRCRSSQVFAVKTLNLDGGASMNSKPTTTFVAPAVPTRVSTDLGAEDIVGLSADDPLLVEYVRRKLIIPPQPNTAYNLQNPNASDFSEAGQTALVKKYLNNKRDGFFIECGGFDGERYSNTLVLERDMGWTGILIEVNPSNFAVLKEKGRRAYAINVGVSPQGEKPMYANFTSNNPEADSGTGMGGYWSEHKRDFYHALGNVTFYEQLCLPLRTILLAINVTHIDYFSLDVEGAELDVLRTVPFDKINITLLGVEYSTNDGNVNYYNTNQPLLGRKI